MGEVVVDNKIDSNLTIYDSFRLLEEKISDSGSRQTLEGAAIIASPSIAIKNEILRAGFSPSQPAFKLSIGISIRDSILNYIAKEDSKDSSAYSNRNIDKYVKDLLKLPLEYNNRLVVQGHNRVKNLPWTVKEIYQNFNSEKRLNICQIIGEIAERRFENNYRLNGYELNKKKRPSDKTPSYIRSEYEFITTIACQVNGMNKKKWYE
ncbi:MAG TPA: hypothetical protein VEC16_00565 [Alphaproteobacteria bacterium]|nr:hypothetical protein [Alphaproteobacteria bacterium]